MRAPPRPGRNATRALGDIVLDVLVSARAHQSGIGKLHAGTLRIRIAAPAIDGKANAALIALLATACAVPKSHVVIEHGVLAPRKRLRIIAPRRVPDWLPGAHGQTAPNSDR